MSPSAVDAASQEADKKVVADLGIVPTPKFTDGWTVDKVTATIPTGKPAEGSSSPLPYFHVLERLKTTKREGWRRFGIASAESIADHMYRMAMLTMLAPPEIASRINKDRCVRMCLIHDMAESIVGDITPVDGVSRPEKHAREAATMDYLCKGLLGRVHGGVPGDEIRQLWDEYEASETLDSKFVHDMDKIELVLQMVEYEKRGRGRIDLGEFAYVATKVELPETKAWAAELLREREEFWAGGSHIHGDEGVAGGVSTDHAASLDAYYDER